MPNVIATFLVSSLLLLSACGSADSGGADSDDSCQYANNGVCDEPEFCVVGTDATDCGGGGGGGGGSSSTVNGLPALEFYEQFLYEIDESDSLPHNTPVQVSGNEVDLSLWLLASGEFYVTYGEFGNWTSETGSWRVEGTRLIVGDIATASGLTYNDQPALSLRFNGNSPSSDVRGQSFTMLIASSNSSLAYHLGRNDDGVCDAVLGDICGYRDETDCC